MVLSAQGGKVIFNEVERALTLLGEAERRIEEMKKSATGSIRIGASDTIFEYFLADKIVEYHEKFPGVKIELVADLTPDTIQKLKTDKIDVAFVNLPIEEDAELCLHGNCMRLNDVFVTSEKYAELANGQVSISKLKEYPLIMMEENTVARKSLDGFLTSCGVSLTPAIEVSSWDLMKRLVARGMGVGVIPREYAQTALQAGELLEIKTDPTLPVRSIGMLLKKNVPVPYALHCFIDQF